MPPVDLLSPEIRPAVRTGSVNDQMSSDDNAEKWKAIIDNQLIEWGWSQDLFDDDEIEPPSRRIVQIAIKFAQRNSRLVPPDRVSPDGQGGIVFERRERDTSEVIHVWDDGSVEYQQFAGTKLVERRIL
jgi:hypothetical protein